MDITTIIEAAAALVAAVITAVVIPYIKSRTTAQQQAEINAWVKIAVTAAEQIYRGSGRGEEKKAYVLNWRRVPRREQFHHRFGHHAGRGPHRRAH